MLVLALLGLVTVAVTAMSAEKDGDRKSAFELKLAELETKVGEERKQIEAWCRKVDILESQFHDVRRRKKEGEDYFMMIYYKRWRGADLVVRELDILQVQVLKWSLLTCRSCFDFIHIA